jgi:putative DNA primase/helicase
MVMDPLRDPSASFSISWQQMEALMGANSSLNIAPVRVALIQRSADVAITLLGQPNYRLSSKRELRFGNRGSLAVKIDGPKVGLWYDHENGEGGDLLDLIGRLRGRGFYDALSYAEEFIGSAPQCRTWAPYPVSKRISPEEEHRRDRALALWDAAEPINNTPAAIYLDWRGVLEPALDAGDGVLRFHPDCPFGEGASHPCLLALMRNINSNEPGAVQRTAVTQVLMQVARRNTFTQFTEARNRVARLTLGPKTGTAIKLSCDEDVAEGLTIGEGLETVLSAMQLGFRPAWALSGTSGIKAFPVLNGIGSLTILVDNDGNGAGPRVALDCSTRWTAAGHEVRRVIPRHPGDDLNDVVRKRNVA